MSSGKKLKQCREVGRDKNHPLFYFEMISFKAFFKNIMHVQYICKIKCLLFKIRYPFSHSSSKEDLSASGNQNSVCVHCVLSLSMFIYTIWTYSLCIGTSLILLILTVLRIFSVCLFLFLLFSKSTQMFETHWFSKL